MKKPIQLLLLLALSIVSIAGLVSLPTAPASALTPNPCPLYPIALSAQSLAGVSRGSTINVFNGTGSGNFGWLSWTGDPSEPTLVTSLTPPGNSNTYVNPSNAEDHVLTVGKSVFGKPGVSNSSAVRNALNTLEHMEITVPVWDTAAGSGGNATYHVSAFAAIQIVSYKLPGQNQIMVKLLDFTCGNSTATPTVTFTPSNRATNTLTPSKAPTHTATATFTATNTFTSTPTATFTNTATFTATHTPTDTPMDTFTNTATFTATHTLTATLTPSNTPTDTPMDTFTPSNTPTATLTPSSSPTNTATPLPLCGPIVSGSTDVALNKGAVQSSNFSSSSGSACLAVDGNTAGNFFDGSVSHTEFNLNPWWQVDLAADYPISMINIWNRTDCCSDRLSNFYIFVSDAPFISTDLVTTLNQSGVSNYYIAGTAGTPTTQTINRTGRYVRIQLAGTDYLSLAEVQVISGP